VATRQGRLSAWGSERAEQQFRERSDTLARDLLAAQPESIDVATRLGPTRVYRWSGEGEPVVFLHGATATSLMWGGYAEARAGRLTYAVDTIGDVGASRQQVAVEGPDDLAGWLEETLAALGLDRAHLAGTSYGGFLALNLAARRPDRVRSLFLIDPCGIAPIRWVRFILWGMSMLLASWLPGPPRRLAARVLRAPMLEDKRVLRLGLYGQLHHRARLLAPHPLPDEQLAAIECPVEVLVAGKSAPFDSRVMAARSRALLRTAEVTVFPDAGHALPVSHRDELCARLASFLGLQDVATG
jgi:pimeloyl-ACP methyl ester carboxylesterase